MQWMRYGSKDLDRVIGEEHKLPARKEILWYLATHFENRARENLFKAVVDECMERGKERQSSKKKAKK
ncbi:unnamed protein product [Linum tenue]|nr:unnamed protein product [Linum tenue]CAI0464475.1 unnamed protein product [Linum tenue]CAI0466551.1 unnamed protein product [Linum tenue]